MFFHNRGKIAVRLPGPAIFLWCLAFCNAALGVTLENDAIRLEVDPQTFSVRYLGRPGGANMVDPVHLPSRQRLSTDLVMPGGILSDVLPVRAEEPGLRRGPAVVVAQRKDYLLLMGPESTDTQLRVKKEYVIHREEPRMTYRLTILSSTAELRTISVRVTAQIPWIGEITWPGSRPDDIRLIRGAYPEFAELRSRWGDDCTVSLPQSTTREKAVLEVPGGRVVIVGPSGIWSRTASVSSAGEQAESPLKILTLLDDRSRTCQVAVEARQEGVNVGGPLVYVEEWLLETSRTAMASRMPGVVSGETSDGEE